ncbi:HAD family hydrolase [Catenovulum sediminis]|uniref:HAD family phosphatase n=1 Tax=Catenovulum sediminis TaxID=1740262 RepID=A0ABV1RH32_9ALTE|nr:HAD family phosphatase [Catenovulum sediminis]
MNKLQALLIDHDGTLVDSEPAQHQIWQRILRDFGIEFSFDEFIPRIGIPGEMTAAYLVDKYALGISPSELAVVKEKETQAYLEQQAFPLMPGILAILQWAKSADVNLRVAIVSGAERASVLRTIKQHALDEFVDLVVAGGDTERSKPHPEPYLKAINQLKVAVQNCCAIEDSCGGIQSAKGAGLRCLAIQHVFTDVQTLKRADRLFSSHQEILAALKRNMT